MSSLLAHAPNRDIVEVEELPAGLTAWEVCRKLSAWPRLLFLDSAQPSPLGRYSFVTADPFGWMWSHGRRIFTGGDVLLTWGDPFLHLEDKLAEYRVAALPGLPPFQGGAAGLFGYELGHHIERLPRPAVDDFAVPDLAIGFYDWVVSFDHETGKSWLVSTGLPERHPDRRERRARQRLEAVKRRLEQTDTPVSRQAQAPIALARPQHRVQGSPAVYSNFTPDTYHATIRRAIEYVHGGDCFQVNIAQHLLTPASLPPLQLYEQLRERNPAPFAGYFDLGDFVIASASPERFLRLDDGHVETRPIKGTRPRGKTPAEDQANSQELRASTKDRAENVMIVDLLRNDLGRVCEFGSVRVDALCRLESHPFVHHLVSAIRGKLREGYGAIDLLRATFPGGSVTGAPKIRAMEIITELEQTARGPYCGSLGYIGFDGSMDTSLLIRTFTIGKGWMQFPVGGGVVADSTPEKEYDETWAKARGLLRALPS